MQDDVIGGAAITWGRSTKRNAQTPPLAQVAGSVGVPAELADLEPLRYYAEYARRYASHDLDKFMELFDERWQMIDHRAGSAEEPAGRDVCRAMTASVFAVSRDVRFTIDEVLACDDRVVAMRASYHGRALGGSGRFAFEGGFVTVVEDGHSISVDTYEYDDNDAMLARFAELTSG
ncbi:MAG TPA: nuclear transport factor 2 family protein [Solirubrobacteraceae bacterium]|nr:nuclear transport factor 2 family protein [Solirubrobacteraceae bacterium]